jgi:hypothetical protein
MEFGNFAGTVSASSSPTMLSSLSADSLLMELMLEAELTDGALAPGPSKWLASLFLELVFATATSCARPVATTNGTSSSSNTMSGSITGASVKHPADDSAVARRLKRDGAAPSPFNKALQAVADNFGLALSGCFRRSSYKVWLKFYCGCIVLCDKLVCR